MPDRSPEETAYRERRRKDPLRSQLREERPDVAPADLSDDPLIAAWQLWDAKPSSEDRVEDLLRLQATAAGQIGVSSAMFHKRVCDRRRDGMPLAAAITAVRAGT